MATLLKSWRTVLGGLVVWSAAAAPVFAQAGGDAPAEKSYVAAYALVILLIGLALMLVLRPVGRATEARPQKGE